MVKIVSENKTRNQLLKFGGGMLRRFGPLYYLSGIGMLMHKLRLDDRSVNNIRNAGSKGPLVYVFYTRSKIDWLALNRVLNQRRLPLADVSLDMRVLWYRPVWDILQQAWGAIQKWSGRINDVELLKDTLRQNGAGAVFLTKASGLFYNNTKALEHLIQIQKDLQQPIQLVPVAVVWKRRPTKVRSDLARFILGSEDQPGPLQKLLMAASPDHEPIVQAGEAISLTEALERYVDQTEKRQVRVIRLLLKRYLYRETHVIQGPKIRSFSWFRRQILMAPDVKELIKLQAKETGKSEEKIRKEVEGHIEHIAARFSFRILKFMAWLCKILWNQIFSGVDVREEDLERIKEATRAGTPILVPSHRSHLDYLLMSSECYYRGLVLPYIVAGENLSFFPVGYFFRGSGAFFIKRSFKKDKIFPVIFARYVQLLIREEIPVEFFIEGGRSRTGKLLHPKLGMLGMVVDSTAMNRPDKVVSILPIAFSYEQIAEEKAYAKELTGKNKTQESVSGVLKARKVLKKRFGKVYLRVGQPIFLNEIVHNYPTKWQDMSPIEHKQHLQEIAERIMHGIGENMLILPTGITALALLTDSRQGIPSTLVQERATRYDALLRHKGALVADSLNHCGWVVNKALQRFESEKWIERIEDEQGDIIRIVPESRITMEYYKNGLIHFLAPISLLAAAILGNRLICQGDETLRLFLVQSFVMRYEFPAHPDMSLEEVAISARESMVQYGALELLENGDYQVISVGMLQELAGLTENFIESYILTLNASLALKDRSITNETELSKKIQQYGKARLTTGEILRPESLSSVNISNAIQAFKEEGVLQFRNGGGLQFEQEVFNQYIKDLEQVSHIHIAPEQIK